MKKIFIMLFAFLLSLPVNGVMAEGFNVVVDNKTANAGDIVVINVSLENNSGLIAALFNVEYDKEHLELISVQDGQLLNGGTFSPSYTSYPYKMVWNSASYTNFTDDGILAILTFKVHDNSETGNAYVNLSYNANDVFDVDLNNVEVSVQNGGINVIEKTASSGLSISGNNHKHSGSLSTSAINNTKTTEDITFKQIILTIGELKATVFGEIKTNDVASVIRNDRTMLPARFVAENLGAVVEWNEIEQKVGIKKGDTEILIFIGCDKAKVNNEEITLDSPAFIENDRTYTPLRFIAEKLGATVEWLGETQEIIIMPNDTL